MPDSRTRQVDELLSRHNGSQGSRRARKRRFIFQLAYYVGRAANRCIELGIVLPVVLLLTNPCALVLLVRKSLLYKISFKIIQILTGVELPCEVAIGRNFRIDHFGDIIISGYAGFGDDCIVRNGVTLGLKNIEVKDAPRIGNSVNIGAGAKILGPISIGNNVDIGANSVVLRDVPDNSLAVGIPARIIPKQNHDR